MLQKLLSFSKFVTILLFLLFVLEILILHPKNLSFKGVITEKLFFWGWILFGFLGFGWWRFGITLLSFLGLSMIPMMIPFLCLIPWSCCSNKHFDIGNEERLEEVWAFGQYYTYLYLVRPKHFFWEEYYQYSIFECDPRNLRNVVIHRIEQLPQDSSTQITIFYTFKDSSQICILNLYPSKQTKSQ